MSNPRTSPYSLIMKGEVTAPETYKETGDRAGLARIPTPFISKRNESDIIPAEEFAKNMPSCYKIRRFYLPSEVSEHCSSDNCWVSKFSKVFDLTKLITENQGSTLADPIVLAAGTDISHWFDPAT